MIKYFCDRCGDEVRQGSEYMARINMEPREDVPDNIRIPEKEICIRCANEMLFHFKTVAREG